MTIAKKHLGRSRTGISQDFLRARKKRVFPFPARWRRSRRQRPAFFLAHHDNREEASRQKSHGNQPGLSPSSEKTSVPFSCEMEAIAPAAPRVFFSAS